MSETRPSGAGDSGTPENIGSYVILSELGRGGMGAVYRAHDARLGRDVALKVLAIADGDTRERCIREARSASSLNHPNILAVYDIAPDARPPYIVTEFVDGASLRQALDAGALTHQRVLRVAAQLADGLAAAHRVHLVHRDLKPENVMLTPDDRVKIVDFGLAKTVTANNTSDTLTAPHAVVGTAPYMSPEQARGDTLDFRSDQFSLGAIIYEMATGRRAFARASTIETLAAILGDDPGRGTDSVTEVPAGLRRIVRRCLEKDPARRYASTDDLFRDLRDLEQSAGLGDGPASHALHDAPHPARTAGGRRIAAWSAALVLAAMSAAGVVASLRGTAAPSPNVGVTHLVVPLGVNERLATGFTPLALSPDGGYLAYETESPGGTRLYLRALSSEKPTLITSSSSGFPFFSPDSEWLGFFEAGKMRKVSVRGGDPVTIADVPSTRGASWGDDGVIVVAPLSRTGLSRVPASGGTLKEITRLDDAHGETSHRFPTLLPGNNAVIFRAEGSSSNDGSLVASSIESGQRRTVVREGGFLPRYAASGHIVYLDAGGLTAAPFDAQRLEVTGAPIQMLAGVRAFSLSDTGTLVYALGAGERSSLAWVNRNGVAKKLPLAPEMFSNPRLSPDQRRVAVGIQRGADRQVWTYDLGHGALTRLTFDHSNLWPLWTPDGRRIVYGSNRPETNWDVMARPADGAGVEDTLLSEKGMQVPRAIAPNGAWVVYERVDQDGAQDLWLLDLTEGHHSRPLAQGRSLEREPAFSPDSRWLAFVSNASGRDEVYVRPVADEPGKWQISTEGGVEPLWNPNGGELIYRRADQVLAAEVATRPTFTVGKTRTLFTGSFRLSGTPSNNYDIARDGSRFLMVSPEEDSAPEPVNIVTNWFEELKRRVPPHGGS